MVNFGMVEIEKKRKMTIKVIASFGTLKLNEILSEIKRSIPNCTNKVGKFSDSGKQTLPKNLINV